MFELANLSCQLESLKAPGNKTRYRGWRSEKLCSTASLSEIREGLSHTKLSRIQQDFGFRETPTTFR